jgi:hypothetical protein
MSSLEYFYKFKYDYSPIRIQIEISEKKLRKQLHEFEFSSLKSRQKVENFKNNILTPKYEELIGIRKLIKGFNSEAFFFGIILFHSTKIFYTKILFYEMKHAFRHILFAISFGGFMGFFVGYTMASSFGLYLSYSRARKNVKKLINDFDYFYVTKHEQEFDE